MSFKEFEASVTARPGAPERVAELERQLLAAYGSRDARKDAKIEG